MVLKNLVVDRLEKNKTHLQYLDDDCMHYYEDEKDFPPTSLFNCYFLYCTEYFTLPRSFCKWDYMTPKLIFFLLNYVRLYHYLVFLDVHWFKYEW